MKFKNEYSYTMLFLVVLLSCLIFLTGASLVFAQGKGKETVAFQKHWVWEKGTVYTNGVVGIQTSHPDHELDINGTLEVENAIFSLVSFDSINLIPNKEGNHEKIYCILYFGVVFFSGSSICSILRRVGSTTSSLVG